MLLPLGFQYFCVTVDYLFTIIKCGVHGKKVLLVREKKQRFRQHLSVDAKEIVKNVFSVLRKRKYNSHKALRETSELTNVPKTTVWNIVNKQVAVRKTRKDSGTPKALNYEDEDMIRRKVYIMYEEQLVPTLDMLHRRLIADGCNINCSRTSLWRCLQRIGFKYRTINKRQVIMESPRLQKWRYEYLTTVQKYRAENRPIIYLDETWYDTHDTVSKGWVDSSGRCKTKAPSNKGKRITILHAGTENGWVPNALRLSAKNIKDSSLDYHEDTTGEFFEDWFKNQLLPDIPPNSVIVMDNAKYHSRELNKVPGASSTKHAIQEYFYDNDIYFEECYTKKQLLEVLKSQNLVKEYICDNMANTTGHCVLRLPPYYCIFNPIEQVWHQVKSGVRAVNTSPTISNSVLQLIRNSIQNVTSQNWKNYVEHAVKIEHSYFNLANSVPEIIINLESDNDSDSDIDLLYKLV